MFHVQSLRKHSDDTANTSYLVQPNTLRFTEIQLLTLQGGLDLPAICRFHVTYNSSDDRLYSLVLCYHGNLYLLNHVKMNGFSTLTLL